MTDLLFRDDAYLKFVEARVLFISDSGGIVFDKSVFYPNSGGQAGDVGLISWSGGNSCQITNTVKTALHLLSVVIPLPVTGGQITSEKGRLDFDMPDAPEDKQIIEDQLNNLIAGDYSITTSWISDDELLKNPSLVKTMSVQPPMGTGKVRLVKIGNENEVIDLQPCGGTHVNRTSEIGSIVIGKVEKKGRKNRRVSIMLKS